jgi:hypothetical protein
LYEIALGSLECHLILQNVKAPSNTYSFQPTIGRLAIIKESKIKIDKMIN